ncbi:hypothetical protein [Streptomyces lavendofoliae]|uniref:Uncharacterized protein n=1 Tax=Streptomyces lavendofoliae TaxID=67314 RepID=A0A918I443_9ACTN|nr:hypothetical protein [Streptomyces lavendofoliae]GGU68961.1 hypothetical protein GCM10010274_66460 [Streptomyces lavendofoliae]
MSSQTQRSTAPTARAQGSHHYVLTLELPGRMSSTWSGTITPHPGASRHDVYMALRNQIGDQNSELSRGNVVFFSLEPNRL